MSEMIERVAKAIYEQRNGFGCLAWGRRDASHKAPYINDAKVALGAMRDPSDDMARAGFSADAFRTPMARLEADFEPKAVWAAMIDEAMK